MSGALTVVLSACFVEVQAVLPNTPALEISSGLRGHSLLKVDEASLTTASGPGIDSLAAPTENSLKQYGGDWLFHVRTTSCHGDAFDNGTYTMLSRVFLPLLFALCVAAVANTALGPGSKEIKEGDEVVAAAIDGVHAEGERKRLWHLDFARICAVMCVIFEHSGGMDYTHRNVGFGLWWALPYLYMTSGMGSMMSKSGMWGYIARLLVIFCVGVGGNWLSDAVMHRDWIHDFGNTIFQMFFVVMLLMMAPLAEPLRQALRWRTANPLAKPPAWASGWAIFWCFATSVSLYFFCKGYTGDSEDVVSQTFEKVKVKAWLNFYAPVLRHSPIMVVHVGGTIFLALLAATVTHPANTGLVGWVLLAFTYAQMVVVPWDQDSFVHLISLNIFAMVTTVWPLRGTETICKRVQAYWPFLLMFLCLDSMPDMWGRCDVHSPYHVWERFRFYLGELTLAVCFVTGSFAPDDPYKVTVWMGHWSLYAYCFHVMWYRLLGSPYGAIMTFAAIPFFWAISGRTQKDKNDKSGKSESTA